MWRDVAWTAGLDRGIKGHDHGPHAMTAHTRPALRWFGGKWKLAPWIIDHMPPHRTYVEPFGGGASVLLRKPRCYNEVYNDLDGAVVNFFRVLRDPDQSKALLTALELTPFARAELTAAIEPTDDPVEWARRLAVLSFMGFISVSHNPRPVKFLTNLSDSLRPANQWRGYPESLALAIERWRGVVVENRDAVDVMTGHDGPRTLHYVDPPYVLDTLTVGASRGYRHDMDDADHERLAVALHGLKGMVMLSGYASPLYDRLFGHWPRLVRRARAQLTGIRTEVLWFNAAAWAGRERQHELPMANAANPAAMLADL